MSKKGSPQKQRPQVRNAFSLLCCFEITGLCTTHLPPRRRLVKHQRTNEAQLQGCSQWALGEKAVLAACGRPAVWTGFWLRPRGSGGHVLMCEQLGLPGLRVRDGNTRPSHTRPSSLEVSGAHGRLALGFKKRCRLAQARERSSYTYRSAVPSDPNGSTSLSLCFLT